MTDGRNGVYSSNKEIEFKTSMIKSSLCDYDDVCILGEETITVAKTSAEYADANNTNVKVIFKNFAPFEKCIPDINNTQVDNVQISMM